MQETWVQSLVQEDPLEKEIETHSSILAWRIPWTEEPHKELDMTEWLTHTHGDIQSSDLYINKGPYPIPFSLHCVVPYNLRKNEKSIGNPELANLKF